MATVSCGLLWLTPLRTPSAARGFKHSAIEYDPTVALTSTQRAGGNYEPSLAPGMQRTAKVTINFASDEDKAILLAWYAAGEPLMLRASDGEKFACTMQSGQTLTPRQMGHSWQVSFTVGEFTYSELAS